MTSDELPVLPPTPNGAGGLWIVEANGTQSQPTDTVPPITAAPPSDDE